MASSATPATPPQSSPRALVPSSSSSSSLSATAASANEAIVRNALRYTISAREYAALHKYVLSRSRLLRRRAPSVNQVVRMMNGPSALPPSSHTLAASSTASISAPASSTPLKQTVAGRKATAASRTATASAPIDLSSPTNPDTPRAIVGADDYNVRAVRHALRVFVTSTAAQRLYSLAKQRLFGRRRTSSTTDTPGPGSVMSSVGGATRSHKDKHSHLHQSSPLRVSLSLSAILFFYRLLFRFITRLRMHLLDPAASPFRLRNPRTAAALTSPYAPAAGASLAGLALGIAPAPFRMSIAIMAVCRALEFAWNAAEDSGAIWGVDMVPVVVRSAVGAAAGPAITALSGGGVASSLLQSSSGSGSPKLPDGVVLRPRVRSRPWWWGSWMLQPFVFGQLLQAAIFDRDCFPPAYGSFIFNRTLSTDTYLHTPPADAPDSILLRWPGPYDVFDALAAMAKASWPPFLSPVLFPGKDASQLLQLPVAGRGAASSAAPTAAAAAVAAVTPLMSRAHPLITSFSCATLHPDDPSCGRTFLTYWLRAFPANARLFLLVYTALQVPRLGQVYHAPVQAMQQLVARALRSAAFLTGSLSTAWASICFFQVWLPRRILAQQRFFLSGFVAGLWAWLERRHGRILFLNSVGTSLNSMWRLGEKRRWWRPASQGADVLVFVTSLLLAGAVYERNVKALREPTWRKGVSWVRGEGWRDWAIEEDDEDEQDKAQAVGMENGQDLYA